MSEEEDFEEKSVQELIEELLRTDKEIDKKLKELNQFMKLQQQKPVYIV